MNHQARIHNFRSNTALPYTWRQELGELDIIVPVPKGTRAKDLSIVIAKKKLSVGLKGKDKIFDGELCQEVKLDDSTWTLRMCHQNSPISPFILSATEDQEAVHIHLEKLNKQQWWENVLTHHPKIDVRKIQPENSKLSELDGETRSVTLIIYPTFILQSFYRGMVEKMMVCSHAASCLTRLMCSCSAV
jgi:hypothetical protein